LAQNYPNIEIIVVDDGSTDDTADVLKHNTFSKRVTFLSKPHSGISATRNFALEKANGEYIAWLDADDYWLAGKLQAQVKYLEEHADCEIVFTNFDTFFNDEKLKTNALAVREFEKCKINKHYLPSALIKRKIFEKSGGFNPELVITEDLDMLYRLGLYGININHYIDNVYYRRRLHGKNITLIHSSSEFARNVALQNLKKKCAKKYGKE
jgi:glycosyltransferase involved in cell wall biosynthesis